MFLIHFCKLGMPSMTRYKMDEAIVHRSRLFPGAEALVWETANWPAAAAVPASLHKVFHQAAAGENQGQTDEAQGQGAGPEKSAQAPWQIEVRILALTLLNHN